MTSNEVKEVKEALVDYKKYLIELVFEDNLELNRIYDIIGKSDKEHIEKLKKLETYKKAKTALKKVVEYIQPNEVEEWIRVVLSDYNQVLIRERDIIYHAKQAEKDKFEKLLREEYVSGIISKLR